MAPYDYNYQSQLEQTAFYEAKTPFEYIEIWNFKDGREPVVDIGQVHGHQIDQWLQKDFDGQQERCSGGLRLLIHQAPKVVDIEGNGPSVFCFGKETFTRIVEAFDLPLAFLEAVGKASGLYASFGQRNAETTGYVLKPLDGLVDYLNGLYTHNSKTGVTCGLFRTNIQNVSRFLLQHIKQSAASSSHPVFLAVMYAEWQADMVLEKSASVGRRLLVVEQKTGHSVIMARPEDYNQFHISDLRQLTVLLSRLSYKIASAELFAASLDEVCKFVLSCLDQNTNHDLGQEAAPLQIEQSIRERLNCVMSSARHALIKLRMYEKRAQFQLSTVHNLIAQQDNILNIEVARDSKSIALASQRDSASMKTIAVLTTCFLPATWVAAFFAVPIFNWNAGKGEAVLSGRFWVYWATTLPLTIAVMVFWYIWMQWRQRRDMADDRRARQSSIFVNSPDEKNPVAKDHQYPGYVDGRLESGRMGIVHYMS